MQDRATRKKKARPIEVKAGSVTVKIYTVKNRRRALYTVTHRGATGLERRQFADLTEAKFEANLIATKIQNGQADVLQLSSEDRGIYLQALEFVRPTGERLNAAAEKYAEAFRIIGAAGRWRIRAA